MSHIMKYQQKALLSFCLIVTASAASSVSLAAEEFTAAFIQSELQRAQEEPDSKVTFEINAPISFVYDFLVNRLDDYVTDAASIEFDHQDSRTTNAIDAGSQRQILMNNGDTLIQRFLSYKPPNQFAYFVDMEQSTVSAPLSYSISHYQLTQLGNDRTTLTVGAVFQSSSRILGYFVRRGFNNAFTNDFEKAKFAIENSYSALP